MTDCSHNHEEQVWIEDRYDDMGTFESCHWETVTESACEDLDLHTYACTLCGKIMSYGDNF